MHIYKPVEARLKLAATLFYFVGSCTDLHSRIKYRVLRVAPASESEEQSALAVILLVTLLKYAVPTCVSASARAY